jgi:magnesium chelatase family protein
MDRAEALEVTRVFSTVGQTPPDRPVITQRPVRTPHHTSSAAAMIGGGSVPKPGEVSLAHRGVLFLDEMPEFPRSVLETLRQPLEDGQVTISRAQGSLRFPARFTLLGAMNPTPRGDTPQEQLSQREMDRYLARLSGPLVDRIDLHVEVPDVAYEELTQTAPGTDTATMREQVRRASQRQAARNGAGRPNAALSGRALDELAALQGDAHEVLRQAIGELGLSARAYDKVRRVARTIADLEEREPVESHHVAEAVQYRQLDRQT